MERKHLPQLDIEQLGKKNTPGWYFEPSNRNPEGQEVVFQCPACNNRCGLTAHSIDTNGEVNASVLCWCNGYHEFVILDGWPSDLKKMANNSLTENGQVK